MNSLVNRYFYRKPAVVTKHSGMNESDASSESGAEDVMSVQSSDPDTNVLPKGATTILSFIWLIQMIMPISERFYVMVSVIEYIKRIQTVFDPHYYLTQERCLCCRSR